MRQIRQTLRLHLEAGLSYAQVGRALRISKSAVGKYVLLARAAGVDWARGPDARATRSSRRGCTGRRCRARATSSSPTSRSIHQELKRAGRHAAAAVGGVRRVATQLAYKYTSFCIKYRAWAQRLKRSMRQTHVAGEQAVRRLRRPDRAGHRRGHRRDPPRADLRGRAGRVELHLRLRHRDARPPPTGSARIIDALEFIGGVPRLIVPDQTRALIARPDRYEPERQPACRGVRATTTACAVLAGAPGSSARQAEGRSRGASRRAMDPGAAAQPALLQPGRAQRAPSPSCWSI